MKWNMVFGALVVSVGLASQSFGFELLDRMLGLNDCGCNSCCQKAAPSCGCDKGCEKRSCCHHGLFDGLAGLFDCGHCCKKSCCKSSCGCAAEPSCGCAAAA